MSTRYVWDKFSVSNKITTDFNTYGSLYVYSNTYPNGSMPEYINTSLSVYTSLEKVNGVINGVGLRYVPITINVNAGYMQNISLGGTYYAKDINTNYWYAVSTAQYGLATGPSPNYDNYVNISLIGYKADVSASVGSKLDTVSSNVNNTYPNNNQSGSYWYTYKGSDNIDPTAITYPSSIKGGQVITLTATKSGSIKYGGTITYTYEVQLNGGSWISIGDSTSLTKSYTVPAGTTTFKARVKARDNMGFTSSTYATGNQVNIINNSAPTISGSDKDLGSFSYLPPYIEYVINDADGNTVSVSIQLDSQSIYSGTAVLGKTEFIVFPDWDSLSNGSHTITITANDGQGGVTTRTYTFSKSVNANLISRERWRRLNEGNVYDVIYFETAADVVTTNNGKYLRDRINAIRSRVAALKGTSDAALAAMDSSIVTERLHMKTDSGYNVKYLDTKSQYVKIGSQTVEEVLTQIESDITALKG